jgi:anti-sigma regulatory factor (Ser/Thr protein kinase)
MKLYFSNSDYLRNFDRFLASADLSDPSALFIKTHPKWISVHPAVLTFAATLALRAGKNVKFDPLTAKSASYLDRIGLFNFSNEPSPFNIVHNEEAGRFIPLTQVHDASEQSRFVSDMIPLLHLPPDKTNAIKYVIGELVRNVLEHSWGRSGAIVAAQYYKKSNSVRLGICDDGIGVRQSMSKNWPEKTVTDIDALKWALTPGISGTTRREGGTEDNAGAGLFFIKSIAKITRDYFMIYSGSGVYRLLRSDARKKSPPTITADPEKDPHVERNDAPPFQGTLVGIDIRLDGTPAFDALLSAIRDVYSATIRERKKQKYKEPRFI